MRRLIPPFCILLGTLGAALTVSEGLNRWLILHAPSSSTYKTHRLFVERPAGEIPLLGSSRALGNYVPSLLSPRVFDYGINGSGMYETLFMLRTALRNPSPGPILVNLDPWGFRGEYTPSFQGDYRLALSAPEVREQVAHSFADRLPGVRFHGLTRANLTTWLDGRMSLTRRVDQGAALLLTSRTEREWEVINDRIGTNTFSCHPSWQTELEQIAATTEHPVVWIVGPVAPVWRARYDGREKLKAFLARLRRRPHMHVVDLFDETADYGNSEFTDPTHLNVRGATRFTRLLAARLRALGLLDSPSPSGWPLALFRL